MKRCSWCDSIIWPWQDQSAGKTMHRDCDLWIKAMIQLENQRQYESDPSEEVVL